LRILKEIWRDLYQNLWVKLWTIVIKKVRDPGEDGYMISESAKKSTGARENRGY